MNHYLLKFLGDFVLCYWDERLIYSNTYMEHLKTDCRKAHVIGLVQIIHVTQTKLISGCTDSAKSVIENNLFHAFTLSSMEDTSTWLPP